MGIETYLDEGNWDRKFLEVELAEVRRAIQNDPKRAWILALDETRQKQLKDAEICNQRELADLLRGVMRSTVDQKLVPSEHARARLLIEGILRKDRQALRLGLEMNQLIDWGRQVSGLSQGRDAKPSEGSVVRLLLDGSTRPRRLGEDAGDHEFLLRALRSAVGVAMSRLFSPREVPSELWARLVVLHLISLSEEDDDEWEEVTRLLESAKLPPSALKGIREAIKGGDRQLAEHLSGLSHAALDFDGLSRSEAFRSGCELVGIHSDPKIMGFKYVGNDPWVSALIRQIKSSDARLDSIRSYWLGLEPNQRTSRRVCLQVFDKADMLSFKSANDFALKELQRVTVEGVQESERCLLECAVHVRAALVAVRLTCDASKTQDTVRRLGGEALVEWEQKSWAGYSEAPASTFKNAPFTKQVLDGLDIRMLEGDAQLNMLVQRVKDTRREIKNIGKEGELRPIGRVWLYRYITVRLQDASEPSGFDAGCEILEDADRRLVARWIKAAGVPDANVAWAREQMSPAQEMRIREAAMSVARRDGGATKSDQESTELDALATSNQQRILNGMDGRDQQHALKALNECVRAVVSGEPGPSRPLMAAFRRCDANEFRRRLLGASVDLPARVPQPSRWGHASTVYACVALILFAWLLLEPLSVAFGMTRPEKTPEVGSPTTELLAPSWVAAPSDDAPEKVVFLMVDARIIGEVFPDKKVAKELAGSSNGREVVEFPVAGELARRLGAWERSKYPAGLPGVGSWTNWDIRLPDSIERAIIAKKLNIPERGIFAKDETTGPHDRRTCVVVVHRTK